MKMFRRGHTDGISNVVAIALVIILVCVVFAVGIKLDRHQRQLIASGNCHAVAEALYTPPPSAHTSCYGDAATRHCSTYYNQPDPYLRTLYRCADPDKGGKLTEFWRRSTDGVGQ